MDIVITWVDATNKEWQKEKAHWYYLFKGTEANHVANYSSFDEVKYVLRSIELYMPYYHHIYLVTNNGSQPNWLKNHPKLTVIDYRELMPNNISTYNSNAIESQLYKIPNLTEYFVYFNDDIILTKPLKIEDLIDTHTGKMQYPQETDIIFSNFQYYTILKKFEQNVLKFDTGVTNARKHTLKLLNLKDTGITGGHTPKILNKTLCKIFNNNNKQHIKTLLTEKFRTNTNFTYIEGYIQFLIQNKIARWNNHTTRIITILDNHHLNTLQIKFTFIKYYNYLAIEDARKSINKNEEIKIINFLNTIFPNKSSFEL